MKHNMKPEIAKKLHDALLSGEFTQICSYLAAPDNQFCASGVLCELYRRETGDGEWEQIPVTAHKGLFFKGNSCFPPIEVNQWATGDRYNEPRIGTDRLDSINDRGTTFAEIAKMLEDD